MQQTKAAIASCLVLLDFSCVFTTETLQEVSQSEIGYCCDKDELIECCMKNELVHAQDVRERAYHRSYSPIT